MRLRHPLIHHSSTAPANQIPKPVAQESVLLVGHQRLAVLPAETQIVTPAVLASLDWNLIDCHGRPSASATHNTTETGNSQGHGPEFRKSYHLGRLVRHRTHCQRHPNPGRAPSPFLGERVLIVYAPQFLRVGESHSAHDHAALGLLLLMVIRLVAQSDFLLLDLSSEFAVDV